MSANIAPHSFRYTAPTTAAEPQTLDAISSRLEGQSTSGSNTGKLVIVDTNNTTPQDITAVNAGGDNIVVTMETGPNVTPSPDWNWIVTPKPKRTPQPPVQTGTTDWNWIVTPTPNTTPPPTAQQTTDWNWIVTPTPRPTPPRPAQRRTTDWNWIVTPTPQTTPSPQTRQSDWTWVDTQAQTAAPVYASPVPNAATQDPFFYGNGNTMGYFGNTVGYYGTPSYWGISYQPPQQTTQDPGVKYGVCPEPRVVGAKCGHRCYRDIECPQDWKCCNDGSGKKDGCCHARKPTEMESFMNYYWEMPPSQEIQNEMP